MADRIINASTLSKKPKIGFSVNNVIQGVELSEKKLSFSIDGGTSFLDTTLRLYMPINDIYTTTLSDYKDCIGTNTYKPEIKNIAYLNGTYGSYYAYYKINVAFDTVFLKDGFVLDIEFRGTKYKSGSGNTPYGIRERYCLQDKPPQDEFKRFYNNITTFELLWFDNVNNKTKLKRDPGHFLSWFIINPNKTITVLMFVKLYNFDKDVSRCENIEQSIDIDMRPFKINDVNTMQNYPSTISKSDYTIETNELMQFDTTINGVPIGEHIADNILSQYKNGKATMTCTVNISDSTPLFVVGEIAKVYGFDGKSISRYRDGTDKRFKITSAELRYNGQITQILEMVEV